MGFWKMKRSIVYQFQLSGDRYTIVTGLLTDYWDTKKKRVPSRMDFAYEINAKLSKLEEYFDKVKDDYSISKVLPDRREIENNVLSITQPETPTLSDKKFLVWEYVDLYISRKRGVKSDGYLKNWPSLREQIKTFAPKLYFDQMDKVWMESFAKYLTVSGLSHNTVVTKITYLRILGRDAMKMGQKVPYDFEDFVLKEIKYPVIYLDWDTHVKALREVVLIPQLDVVRDRFLFRCNTGMREGELSQLKKGNFRVMEGRTWLKYYDLKGKKWKDIVLSPEALALAEKWKFNFGTVSQQEENLLIKQVALLAGITEKRSKITHIGSKVKEQWVPLYDLITTHTARRTFARHWYSLGGDMVLLSKYLGHSDIRITRIYIGLEEVEANNELIRLMG